MVSNETMADSSDTPRPWYTDHRLGLSGICLFVILPLSIPEELSFQKYSSILGTLAATYLTIMVVVKFYLMMDSKFIPDQHSSSVPSWTAIFTVVPTICFGFQCHEASVAIYSSMENRKLSRWIFISVLSMVACLLIYSITGVYGYLTFGADVAADILMSYPDNEVLIIIGRLLFGISIITIYPIILHLGRSAIQELCVKCRPRNAVLTVSSRRRLRLFLTTCWLLVTMVITQFVPDISEVISLIGGISAFFIFIFPGLCLFCTMQTGPMSPRVRSSLMVWGTITILCGVFVFGQSTASTVIKLMEGLI